MVDTLLVGGQIGTSGDYTFVELVAPFGRLLRIECQTLESDISLVGFLGRLVVSGDVNGSITAGTIGPGIFTVTGDPGLFIGGNVSGEIRIGSMFVNLTTSYPAIKAADMDIAGSIADGVLLHGAISDDASVSLASLDTGRRFLVGDQTAVLLSDGIGGVVTIGSVAPTAVIEVIGNVEATASIEIAGAIEGDILITGSLLGSLDLTDDHSLVRHIIVNAEGKDPTDPDPNVWTGPVTIGMAPNDTTLAPIPLCTNLSADIGGGAVGIVPYNLHKQDCVPPSGSTASALPGSPIQQVRLRYYGPLAPNITLGSESSFVERKRQICGYGQACDWEDVTENYSISITGERDLLVSGSFDCGYKYRVTPGPGLWCGGSPSLEAAEIPVAEDVYFLEIFCKTDLSMNGITDTQDVALWLAEPCDIDENGVIDTNDLSTIMSAIE